MASESLRANERRRDERRPARPNLRVCCRKGTTGLGSNLAHALLDLSASGIRLRLAERLEPAQEIEVELQTPDVSRPFRIVAEVVWCIAEDNGTFMVGAEIRHSLTYAELRELTSISRSLADSQ